MSFYEPFLPRDHAAATQFRTGYLNLIRLGIRHNEPQASSWKKDSNNNLIIIDFGNAMLWDPKSGSEYAVNELEGIVG